jgi:hypothetical protein
MKKTTAVLTNLDYNTPRTSLLVFHFAPTPQLQRSYDIFRQDIEGKDVYFLDGFFSEEERSELREYSIKASFSRHSYGSEEGKEAGEKPARSMNNKERWAFFAKPPKAVLALQELFGWFAHSMDAEISLLPWELCGETTSSPAVTANLVEETTQESMAHGKHQDYVPLTGLPFSIPRLYGEEGEFHPNHFENGAPGKPWLISAMLYSTADSFQPSYGMGTVYYREDGSIAFRSDCLDTRLVLFEGDLPHSIEASNIPDGVNTWRVSYVFKLVVNPKKEGESMKSQFAQLTSGPS